VQRVQQLRQAVLVRLVLPEHKEQQVFKELLDPKVQQDKPGRMDLQGPLGLQERMDQWGTQDFQVHRARLVELVQPELVALLALRAVRDR